MNVAQGPRRGVSEVFSAILLVTVVAAVGVSIYLAAASHIASVEQDLSRRLAEREAEALSRPAIVYAYAYNSTGELWLILETGPSKVTVYGVYLGGQPVEPQGFQLPVTLPADSTVKLGPFNALQALERGALEVSVSTSAGDVTAAVDLIP